MVWVVHILVDLGDGASIEQPVFERIRSGGGDKAGFAAEHIQQSEADGFSRLRLRRADGEIGDIKKTGEAPGMRNPQSKGSELMLIAEEVLAEERGDSVKSLGRVDG
jgi:hypothetical protein